MSETTVPYSHYFAVAQSLETALEDNAYLKAQLTKQAEAFEALGYDPADNSREALIKKLPGLERVLPVHEERYGTLINGGCGGRFKDGRFVILLQYERQYLLCFYNPANPKESEETNVALSREAMMSLDGLYSLLGDAEKDERAYLEQLKASECSPASTLGSEG